MQRNPFTRSGALRLNHPLFRGRAAELARLEQACLADLDFFLLVYGGRQNGKTTVLLRLEDSLRKRLSDGVRVCRVDFQNLPRASSREAYRHLARSVARVLPQAPQPPDAPDAPALGDFLEDALAGDAVQRLVLLLDELGTLPDATRADLAHVLRALHTRRLGSPALAKTQFVLAGGIELYDLAVVEASALRNVCEIVRLADLSEADAVAVITADLELIGIAQETATALGQAVYACVRGHPYFTQRLGELLAGRHLSGAAPDAATVDELAWDLLEHDDPLLEHLRRSVVELHLEAAARRLLSRSQRTSRTDDATARLELLGLAQRAGRHWTPRSPLFSVALAEWLGLPVTSDTGLPAAAATIQGVALQYYLADLRLERDATAVRAPAAASVAEQLRLQRRANELADEIARLEAAAQTRAEEPPAAPAHNPDATLAGGSPQAGPPTRPREQPATPPPACEPVQHEQVHQPELTSLAPLAASGDSPPPAGDAPAPLDWPPKREDADAMIARLRRLLAEHGTPSPDPPQATSTAATTAPRFQPGDQVFCMPYGYGEVCASRIVDDRELIQVRFPDYGELEIDSAVSAMRRVKPAAGDATA